MKSQTAQTDLSTSSDRQPKHRTGLQLGLDSGPALGSLPHRSRRYGWHRLPLLITGMGVLLLAGCGGSKSEDDPNGGDPKDSGATPSAGDSEQQISWQELRDLAWERSAYYASLDEWPQARKELAPILADERATSDDWVRAATIELQAGMPGKASEFLQKARVDGQDPLGARYVRARMASQEFDTFEQARDLFESLLGDVPGDLATHYALGRVYEDMDPPDDATWEANQRRAQELYTAILDRGIAHGGAWYVSALYRMYVLSLDGQDPEARQTYEAAWKELESIGAKAVSVSDLNEGELAKIGPPPVVGRAGRAVSGDLSFAKRQTLPLPAANARHLEALDLNGDRLTDLVWADAEGVMLAQQTGDGLFRQQRLWTGSVDRFLLADLSRDQHRDLLLFEGDSITLYDIEAPPEGGAELVVRLSPIASTLPAAPADASWIDYDHDGDLDVLAVGSFGLRLLRNDGVGLIPEREGEQERGTFTDVTETLGMEFSGPLTWCDIEDFDSDQDVDFLVGGPGQTVLASSLRGGLFEDRTQATLGDARPDAQRASLADFDGDSRVDFLFAEESGYRLVLQAEGAEDQQLLDGAPGEVEVADLDLDGQLDVIWPASEAMAHGFRSVGFATREPLRLPNHASPTLELALAEMDRAQNVPIRWEILRLTAEAIEVWEMSKVPGNGMRLRYTGKKDNPDGIGAIIEVRSGGTYQRVYYRGRQVLVGLGPEDYADVVRVTWPNGVSRSEIDVEGGDPFALDEGLGIQTEGLIGSCPFLYTWNGETYEFISDVLGITPLGLPMAPGMLVPPDHDEYVLVKGSQLKPKDGFYEMQFTEELREVTYLDRAELLVIDHPQGTELHPNERFTFPPFPGPQPHLFDAPLEPLKATGSDGRDWTEELRTVDGEYAAPAKALKGQFLGLSEPHWIELSFDPSLTQDADKLRLVATGWFYWTDASVNMATARTPNLDFTPPLILVPQTSPETGEETWVPIGPPVGFPAGKTKSMVIDLTGQIDRADPRFRIHTSLTLYWDALRLAVGDRWGEQRITRLEPVSAELWERGFSAPIVTEDETEPERFDWDVMTSLPRWDQHPGNYTKFGECQPLLAAIDDRFIIMGSGDALTIRFDAKQAPDLQPGMQRAFLVFLDGWAKDRDPNTVEALHVEPLPFHGMGSYPYGDDRAFPSGPVHQAWRKEWNTRPARKLIAPLSAAALHTWVQSGPWPSIERQRKR